MKAPSTNDETRNAANFQRSAAEPVTMVERRVHEDHLEQEDHHHADIVGAAVHQEEAVLPEQAEGLAEEVMVYSAFSGGDAAEVGDARRRRPSGSRSRSASRPACRRRTP